MSVADLKEGVTANLCNFVDTLIDYPRSKQYSFELFEMLGELGILEQDTVHKYKQHVENLELNQDEL